MHAEAAQELLLDEPCRVVVRGLEPGEQVDVTIVCDYGRSVRGFDRVWRAGAAFSADDRGDIDLARDAPISGDWVGDSSGYGPWVSATLTTTQSRHDMGRVIPTTVRLRAASGGQENVVELSRLRWGSGVTKQVVEGEGWRGTLWSPAAGSAVANMVLVGGSGGGPPFAPGSLLASRSIATLAATYFRAPGLPSTLTDIPIEVVVRAARELRRRSELDASPVVLGESRGSELALLAAAYFPDDFSGAIGVVPSGRVHGALGSSRANPKAAWALHGDAVAPGSGIPTHCIAGPVLLLSAEDDQLWPSPVLAGEAMRARGQRSHRLDEHVCYVGAGHGFFRTPGTPQFDPSPDARHPVTGRPMALGGTGRANALACRQAWEKLLDFVRALAGEHDWQRRR